MDIVDLRIQLYFFVGYDWENFIWNEMKDSDEEKQADRLRTCLKWCTDGMDPDVILRAVKMGVI